MTTHENQKNKGNVKAFLIEWMKYASKNWRIMEELL